AGGRLIGMVQPRAPQDDNRGRGGEARPDLYPIGCAGRITSFTETEDGRFLITLSGICRFRIREELPLHEGYRRVAPDWDAFARDLGNEEEPGFDRERLMRALKGYFQQHQISADWDAITAVSGERLVTSISMICPFDPSEKQALLEAPDQAERARLLTAIVEMALIQPPSEGTGARH
ncbi:MAG: LON peptidase substrate-binding domain-containing protein, partial [Alphaproteobacteria bacterium]|nr:LON peptidase substrate-binding domain-containing protein [Alphaproteobacteria bacterium]